MAARAAFESETTVELSEVEVPRFVCPFDSLSLEEAELLLESAPAVRLSPSAAIAFAGGVSCTGVASNGSLLSLMMKGARAAISPSRRACTS